MKCTQRTGLHAPGFLNKYYTLQDETHGFVKPCKLVATLTIKCALICIITTQCNVTSNSVYLTLPYMTS